MAKKRQVSGKRPDIGQPHDVWGERVALVRTRDLVVSLATSVNRALRQASETPRTTENERERFATALFSIAMFFGRFQATPIADRLFELGSAIADLNLGISSDLLKPSNPGNRRPDSSQLWRARARVVLGLDALVRAGCSPPDAALQIERNFSELKRLVSGKRRKDGLVKVVLSETIKDWRKKFAAGSLKSEQAMTMYQVGKEVIQHLAGQGNARLHDFANAQLSAAVKFCGALSAASALSPLDTWRMQRARSAQRHP